MIVYTSIGGANSLASMVDPALLSCVEAEQLDVLVSFAQYPKLYDSMATIINKAMFGRASPRLTEMLITAMEAESAKTSYY